MGVHPRTVTLATSIASTSVMPNESLSPTWVQSVGCRVQGVGCRV